MLETLSNILQELRNHHVSEVTITLKLYPENSETSEEPIKVTSTKALKEPKKPEPEIPQEMLLGDL